MTKLHELGGVRVLVVEDDLDARDMYRIELEHWGAEVRTTWNADLAFDVALEWLPHVVVTDFLLRGGPTGAQLCTRLRSELSTAHIPTLVVTGSTRTSDAEVASGAGCVGLRIKPYLPEALATDVQQLAASAGLGAH